MTVINHLRGCRDAYDLLAPHYDALTDGYEHDRWIAEVLRLLAADGLTPQRALDVGCGTGKSFLPLLARGVEVSACDLSPAMVAQAAAKAAGRARVFVADARELPPLGPVDLVTCLDDALNHLLEPADLARAFTGMAACLRPGGALVFDLNSLKTFRTMYVGEHVVEAGGATFRLRGRGSADHAPGAVAELLIETSPAGGAPVVSRQVQRHHPPETVLAALAAAGFDRVRIHGQLPGVRIEPDADDTHHTKLLYIARLPEPDPEEVTMFVKPFVKP